MAWLFTFEVESHEPATTLFEKLRRFYAEGDSPVKMISQGRKEFTLKRGSMWGMSQKRLKSKIEVQVGDQGPDFSVASVSYKVTTLVFDESQRAHLESHLRKEVDEFRLNHAILNPGQPATVPAAAGSAFVTELERIAKLREDGLLNKDEYEAAKKKLLG